MNVTIPYAIDFAPDTAGSILKHVHCELCQYDFFYRVHRTSHVSIPNWFLLAKPRAQPAGMSSAQEKAVQVVQREADPVPCPQCGAYQPAMIPQVKHAYCGWVRQVAYPFFLVAATAFAVWLFNMRTPSHTQERLDRIEIALQVWLVSAAVAGILILGRWLLAQLLNPNSPGRAEQRKQLGQTRQVARLDFDQAVLDNQHEADRARS